MPGNALNIELHYWKVAFAWCGRI